MRSQAFIPQVLATRGNTLLQNAFAFVSGTALLILLAQLSFRLPFTPVPITGQTFGVALIALLWGASRSSAIFTSYLLVGAAGFPVFSLGRPLMWGPTVGYLAGMLLASLIVGRLADRGWTRGFGRALLAAYCGSFCVFGLGLLGLSFFIPAKALLAAGLLPFLAGDLIKNSLAALIASKLRK